MTSEVRNALAAQRKFTILDYARTIGNVQEACRDFGVPRSTFYRWRKAYSAEGKAGLLRKKPVARSHSRQIPAEFVEKILHLRTQYHLGPQRIAWYLERYRGFSTSCSSVYRTLKRNGVGRLPRNVGRRAIHTRRYAKQVAGHQIQIRFQQRHVDVGAAWRTDRKDDDVRKASGTPLCRRGIQLCG